MVALFLLYTLDGHFDEAECLPFLLLFIPPFHPGCFVLLFILFCLSLSMGLLTDITDIFQKLKVEFHCYIIHLLLMFDISVKNPV